MKSITLSLKLTLLPLVLLAFPILSTAQGVIQRASTPYVAQPDIQFSIAAPTPAAAAPSPRSASAAPLLPPTTKQAAQTWAIEPTDLRLVDAFSRWTKKAGMQLRWDATRHVEVGAIDVYDGDATEAMIAALSSPSIANSDYPLEVCFYPNRPTLARVTRRGEQWRDCPFTQPSSSDANSSIQK